MSEKWPTKAEFFETVHNHAKQHDAIVEDLVSVNFARPTKAAAFRAAADWIDENPGALVIAVSWDTTFEDGDDDTCHTLSLYIER